MIFPDDDNGDVLRRMESHGDDVTQSRAINFSVVFPSENSAREFSDRIGALGYAVTVSFEQVEEGYPWGARVVKEMVPEHQTITEFERLLESIAKRFGGFNDGWGCFARPFVR